MDRTIGLFYRPPLIYHLVKIWRCHKDTNMISGDKFNWRMLYVHETSTPRLWLQTTKLSSQRIALHEPA